MKKLKQLRALSAFAKKQSVGMQRKLMLYWVSMIMLVFATLIFLLAIAGVFSKDDKQLHEVLATQLQNTQTSMEDWCDTLAAHSLTLAKNLSKEIEKILVREGISLQEVNDHPERILMLEEAMYPLVNTTLQTANCNGAYAILDVTTNTKLDIADSSRSGIYLRYSNLSATNPISADIVYFRGLAEIAYQKELELHNRWDLEFDTSHFPKYQELIDQKQDESKIRYSWTSKVNLKNTWESAILLCVPIVGSDGTVFGICGVELSKLYFCFSYPAFEGQFGSVIAVMAPVQDNRLQLDQGLAGGVSGAYLAGNEIFSIHRGRYYNEYISDDEHYIGLQAPLKISNENDPNLIWSAAILIPKDSYASYNSRVQQNWILASLGLLSALLIISFFLSRRFVRPITKSLKWLQQEEVVEKNLQSGISEIDELTNFLNTRARHQRLEQGDLPQNIAELFDNFIRRKALLTEAERNIFNYYIEGYEISEIPDLAFISMSTVRKHNRKIYEKLNVSSRDELMLYLDLLRRCGRLDELR